MTHFASAQAIFELGLEVVEFASFTLGQAISFSTLYGSSAVPLIAFGSVATWRVEARILGRLCDTEATEFKKSIQDECTMVSVAVGPL